MTTLERLDALIERGVFYDCDWETLKTVRDGSGELLEALERLVNAHPQDESRMDFSDWTEDMKAAQDEWIAARENARAAISKAKGEA